MTLSRLMLGVSTILAALGTAGCASQEDSGPAPAGSETASAEGETRQTSAALASGGGFARLGHVLDSNAPLFPGDPPFSSTIYNTIENDGYKLELISMGTHTGTHMSAPCHFLTGTLCIDQLPASAFVLPSYVLDVRGRIAQDPAHADFKLTVQDIKNFEASIGTPIPAHAIVILFTGFQDRWGKPSYFDLAPGFSKAAVNWMIKNRGISSLGSDTFGPDASTDSSYEASTAIYSAGGTTIENMAGLDRLHAYGDTVVSTPARLKDGSGFPTSPIGILR